MSNTPEQNLVLKIERSLDVAAPPEAAFRAVIDWLTTKNNAGEGNPMPMKMEEWPGGRWYRDLGDNTGHLWGHVQSIKPPNLLEICGPMFMSLAVASNLIIRIAETDGGARITLRHQVLGPVPDEFRSGLKQGWDEYLADVKNALEA